MLPGLFRLVRWQWTWVAAYLSRIWAPSRDQIAPTEIIPKASSTKASTVESVDHLSHEFPIMTDDQYRRLRKNFIESLDLTAICDLASKHNDGKACRVVTKTSGSFNVCFFIEFDGKGPEWVVRVPIQPAFDDACAWTKLQSEVTTIQYLKQETRVPVPCIYAYGRDATLTKSSTGTQMFIISEFVQGHPLNKSVLKATDDEHKETFYSQLIDVLADLRKLEFSAMGSLMPNTGGRPQMGPVISMSSTTLQQPHNSTVAVGPPKGSLRGPFTSAVEYMKYQLSLVSAFLLLPVSDHTIDDIKEEIFAFCSMEQASHELFTSRQGKEPCVLQHLDLRSANIIVDGEFNIKAIIDWEFSGTIPRRLFAPPSWITGHDSDELHEEMHADFRAVLDEKRRVHARYEQLWEEWYAERTMAETNKAFYVAHVLRRPTDVADIFCAFAAQEKLDTPLDDLISDFFDHNPALALEARRRAEQCERYTQYLKDNGLYETDLDRLLARSEALKATWR